MKIMGVSENMPIKSITESLSHGSEVALLTRVDTDKVNNSENETTEVSTPGPLFRRRQSHRRSIVIWSVDCRVLKFSLLK